MKDLSMLEIPPKTFKPMNASRRNIQPKSLHTRLIDGRALYSHVVAIDEGRHVHVYVSGQLSRDSSGNIVGKGNMAAQIEQVGRNLEACLASTGAGLEDLVKTTTYVTDIDEFFRHNETRMRFFGPGLPTSTTVEVRRLSHPDFMVEIAGEAIIEAERYSQIVT
jgi:2-iminobutanoate/2-iminopropanoate deaminase